MPYDAEYNRPKELFDTLDAEILAAQGKYHVLSGCAITYSATDMVITVAAGKVAHDGTVLDVVLDTVTPTAPPTVGKKWWYVFGWNSAGNLVGTNAAEAANTTADPAFKPTQADLGDITVIGMVLIQQGTTIINNAELKLDKRHQAPTVLVRDTTAAVDTTMTADVVLTSQSKVVQAHYPDASWRRITLPDATTLAIGDSFTFINLADPLSERALAYIVEDNGGTFVGGVAPGAAITLDLTNNATANGTWRWREPITSLDNYNSTQHAKTPSYPGPMKVVPGPQAIDGSTGNANTSAAIAMLDATRGILAVMDRDAPEYYARGFQINTTTGVITYGAKAVVESTAAEVSTQVGGVGVIRVDDDTAVVVASPDDADPTGYVVNFTAGTTTISSVGAQQTLFASAASLPQYYNRGGILLDTNKIVTLLGIGTYYVVASDRSGDTLTSGTAHSIGLTGNSADIAKLDTSRFFVATATASGVVLYIKSVSGTTISSVTNDTITDSASGNEVLLLHVIDATTLVVIWESGNAIRATLYTYTTTTLTEGTTYTLGVGPALGISSTYWSFPVVSLGGSLFHLFSGSAGTVSTTLDSWHMLMDKDGSHVFTHRLDEIHAELYNSTGRPANIAMSGASGLRQGSWEVLESITAGTRQVAVAVNSDIFIHAVVSQTAANEDNPTLIPYRVT